MMNHESKRPVTLEDLLRLKRAERPAPEFWERFERELRAKQLAAIVEKRPWWGGVPRLLGGLKRYQLPLGATAILAVTFISVRQYQTAVPTSQPPARAEEVATVADTPAPSAEFAEIHSSLTPEITAPVATVAVANEATSNAAPAAASSEGVSSGRVSAMVPWLAHTDVPEVDGAGAPAVQSLVAANLETVKATHPELARRFLGSAAGFEITTASDRKVVDPFTRMKGPADLKRERLLAKALPVAASVSWNNGERIARKLSEDRLTEEAISRIGASGDRLSLKF